MNIVITEQRGEDPRETTSDEVIAAVKAGADPLSSWRHIRVASAPDAAARIAELVVPYTGATVRDIQQIPDGAFISVSDMEEPLSMVEKTELRAGLDSPWVAVWPLTPREIEWDPREETKRSLVPRDGKFFTTISWSEKAVNEALGQRVAAYADLFSFCEIWSQFGSIEAWLTWHDRDDDWREYAGHYQGYTGKSRSCRWFTATVKLAAPVPVPNFDWSAGVRASDWILRALNVTRDLERCGFVANRLTA